ncbi:MAG TPA: alpha/beta hydrolase [Candidatus Baltobacteraceae bacterium]
MILARTTRAVATVAIALALAAPVAASIPPPAPAPTATFNVGSLHVTQYGSGAQTLIFIPGLTCGPWEWSGEIAHYAPNYTIYALTLPGFDGQAPIAGPLFQTTTADFWKLLEQKRIDKPVVIGHSLGGTMGFMLATQHPERLRGVIALDGLPIYPTDVMMTPDQVKTMAAGASAAMQKMTPAQFAATERTTSLPYMITAQSDIDAVAPLAARSDPGATARWFYEDLTLDLRPQLHLADVPILLIAPYDATLEGKYLPTPAAKRDFYAGIVKGAPNATVVTIDHSRHFAMYDQPQALDEAIAQFLAKLP